MHRVIPWGNEITLVTKVTREGVSQRPGLMDRTVGLKFPAPTTIIIYGTGKKLDEVRNQKSRNLLRQFAKMTGDSVDLRDPIL